MSVLSLLLGVAQCALCREVYRTGAGEGLVRGIRWSWLLLVVPFLAAMGGVAALLFQAFRRRDRS